MPAARYWRMVVRASTAGVYVSLSEVAFLDANMTDLSVGGTAFASSVYSSGWEADRAFDKNVSTSWSTVGYDFPAHIGYDHGGAVNVEYVRFRGYSPTEYPSAFSDITLQWSDDGTTWSTPSKIRFVEGTFTDTQYCTLALWDGSFSPVFVTADFFVSSATPSGMPTTFFMDATAPYRDMEFSGGGVIAGTVKRDADPSDLPLKRRVRLHRERDGMLVREVWSDPVTGAYSFDYIDATKTYTVITYDYEHNYRAVIADNIAPEPMP